VRPGTPIESFFHPRLISEAAADEFIKDKDRAQQVVSISKQATESYVTYSKKLDELSEKLVKMNKNYDLTRAEMAAFSDKAENNRMAFFNKYVELRLQLKDLMTAKEWEAKRLQ
jgi:hypothetical protein